jgi:hypothetical protein
MKGTIIVTQRELVNCPEMEQILLQLSDSVGREGDNTLFFSREGALMTMICELLDKDVKYTLNFEKGTGQSIEGQVKVGATNT